MKKILVVLLVMAASATSVFAVNQSEYDVFYRMNNKSTFKGLVRYLDADYVQAEQLELVFSMTEKKLNSALKVENEIEAEKVLFFNLGNVKYILSEDQYKKYLVFVNLSIYNKKDTFIASI